MQQRDSKQSSMLMQEIMLKTDILLLEIWFCSEEEERTDCLQHIYEPCEVCGHNGDQVVMKSPKGVEYKRKF